MLILSFYNDLLQNYFIPLEVSYQNDQITKLSMKQNLQKTSTTFTSTPIATLLKTSKTPFFDFLRQNQYLSIMCGMYLGSYFSRSFFYDYMLESGFNLTIVQTVNVACFVFF